MVDMSNRHYTVIPAFANMKPVLGLMMDIEPEPTRLSDAEYEQQTRAYLEGEQFGWLRKRERA